MSDFVNLKNKKQALHLSGDAWLSWDGFKEAREWEGLTVEVWVNLKTPGLLHGLITADFALSLGEGGFSFHPGADHRSVHVPYEIKGDEWNHLAVVLDRDKKLTTYVNGSQVSEHVVADHHQFKPESLTVGLLPMDHPAHTDRAAEIEDAKGALEGKAPRKTGDSQDALNALEGKPAKHQHASLNGYIGALNIWSLAREKHEILVDMYVEPPAWSRGLVLSQWMEKEEDIQGYEHHGHTALEAVHCPVMDDLELAEFLIPDPNLIKGRLADLADTFSQWDENSIYERFKDQKDEIPLICTRYIADINPDDDNTGENKEEDGVTLYLNPNSKLIMMSRSESDEWHASFADFDHSAAFGKGAATEHDEEAELYDLHLCDEDRAYFAYSGEFGSLSYALLVRMTHVTTGEVKWVVWDPIIEVGTRPTTGGGSG